MGKWYRKFYWRGVDEVLCWNYGGERLFYVLILSRNGWYDIVVWKI